MSASDLLGLFPLIVLAGASILVLLAAAFIRRLVVSFVVTLIGLVAALVFVGIAGPHLPLKVAALLSFDGFVLFGFVLILAATVFVAISSWAYLRGRDDEGGDYYFLLILSSLGACILAALSNISDETRPVVSSSRSLVGIPLKRHSPWILSRVLCRPISSATTSSFSVSARAEECKPPLD
jgi:hypothetical protein